MLGSVLTPLLLAIAMVLTLIFQIYNGSNTAWYEWVIYLGYPSFLIIQYFVGRRR